MALRTLRIREHKEREVVGDVWGLRGPFWGP